MSSGDGRSSPSIRKARSHSSNGRNMDDDSLRKANYWRGGESSPTPMSPSSQAASPGSSSSTSIPIREERTRPFAGTPRARIRLQPEEVVAISTILLQAAMRLPATQSGESLTEWMYGEKWDTCLLPQLAVTSGPSGLKVARSQLYLSFAFEIQRPTDPWANPNIGSRGYSRESEEASETLPPPGWPDTSSERGAP